MPGSTSLLDHTALQRHLDAVTSYWGRLVRRRRTALGLTTRRLAELAGTSVQSISKIERGQICPRDHLRISIAAALTCDASDLFPYPNLETALAVATPRPIPASTGPNGPTAGPG